MKISNKIEVDFFHSISYLFLHLKTYHLKCLKIRPTLSCTLEFRNEVFWDLFYIHYTADLPSHLTITSPFANDNTANSLPVLNLHLEPSRI